jgi:hypothetical protein
MFFFSQISTASLITENCRLLLFKPCWISMRTSPKSTFSTLTPLTVTIRSFLRKPTWELGDAGSTSRIRWFKRVSTSADITSPRPL